MRKFYRQLPQEVIDILSVSNGWLIGSSIQSILNDIIPNDYDIIIPQPNYRLLYRFLRQYNPEFNNHGGVKVNINDISIDIWIESLDTYLDRLKTNFTYAYNFNSNLLIKSDL